MSRHISLRALAGALGLTAVASCTHLGTEVLGEHARRGDRFDSYVALGNSITAGFQGGGITEATQRTSYAALLAISMGTRFQMPLMLAPGCPPAITSFLTQARPAGTTGATCALRNPAATSDVINNVAVPGATSADPTSLSTTASNALTTFFLAGRSQVQRANEANPTFVSIWIGNNDVLGPAVSQLGTTASLATMNDSATFAANYDRMLDSLTMHNANLNGVLIGVVDVTAIPLLFAGSAFSTASFKTAFDQIACGAAPPVGSAFPGCFGAATAVLNCATAPGNASRLNLMLAFAIRTGQHPATISCVAGGGLGDAFVLDAAEQATVTARVTQYNNHVSARATSNNFAFWNPNNTTDGLPSLRADTTGSLVRITPQVTANSFGANPFGTGMSTDGVHPGNTLHVRIANAVIAVINAKYGTALPNAF